MGCLPSRAVLQDRCVVDAVIGGRRATSSDACTDSRTNVAGWHDHKAMAHPRLQWLGSGRRR